MQQRMLMTRDSSCCSEQADVLPLLCVAGCNHENENCPAGPDEDEECQPKGEAAEVQHEPSDGGEHGTNGRGAQPLYAALPAQAARDFSCISYGQEQPLSPAAAELPQGQPNLVRQPSCTDRPALTWADQPAALSHLDSEPTQRSEPAAPSPDARSHTGAVYTEGGTAHRARGEADEAARDDFAEQQEPYDRGRHGTRCSLLWVRATEECHQSKRHGQRQLCSL